MIVSHVLPHELQSCGRSSPSSKVAVVIGATSKWQRDGSFTMQIHGKHADDRDLDVTARWGVGGAIAQRFASEGFHVVLTTRHVSNAKSLEDAIRSQGGQCSTIELELSSEESIIKAFKEIRESAGDPDVVVYNAGYAAGRELPPEKELLEHIPTEMFDLANHVAMRGPFLIAKEVLPAMRAKGTGSLLFTNNPASLRGRKRYTGESLYYPRVLMRTLAQVLTEEYSEHGVHVANVVVDGFIDSPGTRALPRFEKQPGLLISPAAIADAFWYLHTQDPSCWTHEIQLTPRQQKPTF